MPATTGRGLIYTGAMDHHDANDAITLQPATVADVPALIAMDATAPARIYSPLLTAEAWATEMAKYAVMLIKLGDVVVGSVGYGQTSPGEVYISGLIVRPEYRGRGVATAAMRRVIGLWPAARRIYLATHPDNPARRVYERLGFKVEGVKDDYFGDGEPRLILAMTRG